MGHTHSQLVRLLSEMIQFGTIIEVQAKPLRYKVQFDENRVSGWIPMNVSHAAEVRSWKPLQVGEQVVVLKPFGAQGGVIVASLNQTKFDQPKDKLNLYYHEFPDGTWLEYDMEEHKLTGHVEGDLILTTAGNAKLTATQNVEIKSSGDMTFNSEGTMTFHSKGQMSQSTDATMNLHSAGEMTHSADSPINISTPRLNLN
ncbi:phage baseplate assembly protein V [Vibrio vulnificus]|uniref:phage baseplate assembly protein V n=1 Tax=Vibrio vulnificus TaxID=672 RepID=UPI00188D4E05|nr:phage baseplate assembly protein V [Vibrio vulnificus]MBF4450155.1 phage baseplate assembly protein V [Vibrio vulnificus]MBF4496765.1 phage baseplate assembly protein V [Vibrio vulnificus]MBL6178215.1 phage baseplate assembly protein V [Vibrio vulnificus]HDY7980312.1 phage baseplate assembly protein V [Vibrio vulnificus]HDY8003773.1 phage baseplate assembly protein V [Vibrio vulnificus]